MWKKNELNGPSAEPTPTAPTHYPEPVRNEPAIIGPSITIKGDITGEEDLEVQGNLEGNISIKKHTVTVAQSGRVKADIQANAIHIAGEVKGNIIGDEEVVLRSSGRVLGNITAGRVTLENGSKFKGSIDMEPASDTAKRSSSVSTDKMGGSSVERNPEKHTNLSKVN
jgi:cytoskeletal protein CcmA (bactofilin family)